jgi:hypothetical protein
MEKNCTPPDDSFMIRCPRLGHQIYFSYCRSENQGLPCFKAIDCWYHHFPVKDHLEQILTPEEWENVFGSPPKPKMLSLLELIEKAKMLKTKKSKDFR